MGVITHQQLYEAAEYVWNCMPSAYVIWHGGTVSSGDGPPAWGVNAPPPPASKVRRGGAFCAFVPNAVHRHLGLKIPNPYNDEAFDGGIVSYWEAYYDASEWFSLSASYPDGTFVMSPYGSEAVGDQGHVGMIWQYNGTPYVMEWILNPGGTWNYTLAQSNEWGKYQIAIRPEAWVPLAGGVFDAAEATDPLEPAAPESKEYPGDLADPDVVARWMARVAYEEYLIAAILPVQTSYVELTRAWTGPGDVRTVPGYLGAVDYDSLGYFQQRPSMGWGTPEQLTDANYALRQFCQVAYGVSGGEWHKDQTDPRILGEWCQAVQRSGVPDAYREKGYPAATKLIAGWDKETPVTPAPVEPTPVEPPEHEGYPFGWFGLDERGYIKAVDVPKGSWFEPVKYSDGHVYLTMHTDPAWRKARERKADVVEFREKNDEIEVRYPDDRDGQYSVYSRERFDEIYVVEKENE